MLKTNEMEDQNHTSTPEGTLIPWSQPFLSRPKVMWNKFILCQGHLETQTLNTTEEQLGLMLFEIYPNKNLIDIFNLLTFFKKQQTDIDPRTIALAYGFHWTEYHNEFLSLYGIWPKEFLNWCQQKNMQITDLRPLLLLKNNSNLQTYLPVLVEIANQRGSYSEGKTIIELTVDLFCQNTEITQLQKSDAKDNTVWISRLKKLRYPLTHDMDQAYKTFVEKQRWPLQCQFKRQGDKKGFQVSVFITNANDVEKSKQNINQSFEKISKFYEDQA